MSRVVRRRRAKDAPILTAGSVSSLGDYDICPAKVRFKRAGYKDESAALDYGRKVHDAGEAYLRDSRLPLPAAFRYFEDEMRGLRVTKAEPEVQYAFRKNGTVCPWMADDVYFRGKVDAQVVKTRVARCVDYKTGRVRESDQKKMDGYAVSIFLAHPKVQTVKGELWYLKTGDVIDLEWRRKTDFEAAYEALWLRVERMVGDRVMEPRPGPLCGWCAFSKAKGGPCPGA